MSSPQSTQHLTASQSRRDGALGGIANALQRFSPLLSHAAIAVVGIAVVGLVAGGALSVMYWQWQTPVNVSDYIQFGVVAAVFLAPAVILGLFAFALHEVSELPERLRNLPENARQHSSDLGQISRDLSGIGEQQRSRTRSLLHLGRVLYNARDDILIYIPLLELANPLFLLAVLMSFAAVGIETMVVAAVVVQRIVTS